MSQADEAARLIARLGDSAPSPQVIRAYHGSPRPEHFDKFDARYIGSGEGNQAFAYGHYLAQNPAVGSDYRRALSHRKFRDDFLNNVWEDAGPEDVMDSIGVFDHRQQRFLRALQADDFLGYDYPSQAINAALRPGGLRQYEVGRDISQELVDARANLGTGYEVSVRVSPEQLLDWDAPIQGQRALDGGILERLEQLLPNGGAGSRGATVSMSARNPHFTGGNLWAQSVDAFTAARPLRGSGRAAPALAADALHEAGIPGVQYLDHGSRRSGDGTRNLVIFPRAEDSIRILRKFAVPGVVGAGAAASMTGGE